jgi:hypothetical protein
VEIGARPFEGLRLVAGEFPQRYIPRWKSAPDLSRGCDMLAFTRHNSPSAVEIGARPFEGLRRRSQGSCTDRRSCGNRRQTFRGIATSGRRVSPTLYSSVEIGARPFEGLRHARVYPPQFSFSCGNRRQTFRGIATSQSGFVYGQAQLWKSAPDLSRDCDIDDHASAQLLVGFVEIGARPFEGLRHDGELLLPRTAVTWKSAPDLSRDCDFLRTAEPLQSPGHTPNTTWV